ncbi:MAG: extracellular solute-binding protein [Lachnospiraceae bacterium]|nr:extracellular solute-binding protein [Lachnospiraceae bacterium]
MLKRNDGMMKRVSALVLGAALAATTAVWAEETTTDADAAVELDYEAIEKPESISWCSHDGMLPENGQTEWDAEYERLTGIDLEHTYVTGNEYNDKIELDYAADTVPDVFDLSSTYFPKYVAEGAVADLTDLVKASGLYDLVDESIWEQCSYEGRIYGVPKEIPQACGTYVRKDWLDRLDMEVPETYEEFITMLTRFRDEIDECLMPYTAPGLVTAQYLPDFYQGAFPGITEVDGEWIDGMQQENIKDALQKMQDAYAEGLLDMEAITNTTATCRDNWESGSAGAFCYWTGNWGQQLTYNLQKNVPEAEVICIPAIEGAVYLYSTPTVHVINGRLSEEEVAQVFKYFVGYMHDGGEGQVLFEYGVEGVHWEQDGENVKMLPSLSDPNTTLNKAYILPSSRLTPLSVNDKNMVYSDPYLDSLAVTDASAKNQSFQPASETYSLISSDLTIARDTCVAEIVTGAVSVEEGLASYKEIADSLNLEQALEEMNAN